MNIVKSIRKEPEKWNMGEYWFRHNSGVCIWVANGLFGYDRNHGGTFSLIQKIKINRAITWWSFNYMPKD